MPTIRELATKLGLATCALGAMVWSSACGVGAVNVADSNYQNPGQQSPAGSPAPAADTPAVPGTPAPAVPAGAPAGATLTGAVASHMFTPKSAIFAVVSTGGGNVMAVKLSDQEDDCALIKKNAHRHGAMSFWLRLVGDAKDGATFAIDAGAPSASTTSATQYVLDDTCQSALDDATAWATEGKVTLEKVSDAKVSGTFKLMVGSQRDAVQGTFSAAPCAAMENLIKAPDSARTCE